MARQRARKPKGKPVVKSSKKQPTPRQLKAAELRASGLAKCQALQQAGYPESVAYHAAEREFERPGMKAALADALKKAGCTKNRIAQVLQAGLDATKVISANVIASHGEGMKDANSMTRDFVDVPDFTERRKTAETISELSDWYPSEKVDMKHSGSIDFATRLEKARKKAIGADSGKNNS